MNLDLAASHARAAQTALKTDRSPLHGGTAIEAKLLRHPGVAPVGADQNFRAPVFFFGFQLPALRGSRKFFDPPSQMSRRAQLRRSLHKQVIERRAAQSEAPGAIA
jgi:hypothetical protein